MCEWQVEWYVNNWLVGGGGVGSSWVLWAAGRLEGHPVTTGNRVVCLYAGYAGYFTQN